MAAKVKDVPPPPSRYACSSCGQEQKRDNLLVKVVRFKTFGRDGRVVKSRVSAWLCPKCREADSDWTRDENKGGPPSPPKVKA